MDQSWGPPVDSAGAAVATAAPQQWQPPGQAWPPPGQPWGRPTGPSVGWAVLLWCVAALSVVGALLFGVFAVMGFWVDNNLDDTGVTTSATVVDVSDNTVTVEVQHRRQPPDYDGVHLDAVRLSGRRRRDRHHVRPGKSVLRHTRPGVTRISYWQRFSRSSLRARWPSRSVRVLVRCSFIAPAARRNAPAVYY